MSCISRASRCRSASAAARSSASLVRSSSISSRSACSFPSRRRRVPIAMLQKPTTASTFTMIDDSWAWSSATRATTRKTTAVPSRMAAIRRGSRDTAVPRTARTASSPSPSGCSHTSAAELTSSTTKAHACTLPTARRPASVPRTPSPPATSPPRATETPSELPCHPGPGCARKTLTSTRATTTRATGRRARWAVSQRARPRRNAARVGVVGTSALTQASVRRDCLPVVSPAVGPRGPAASTPGPAPSTQRWTPAPPMRSTRTPKTPPPPPATL